MHNESFADTRTGTFDEIILPHLDAAHNLARWLVRDAAEAEDVVQEACLRALRYFATFRGGNARAWLLRIVRTTAFVWMQKNRPQRLATEFDEAIHSEVCEAVNPEVLLHRRADTQMLDEAMSRLPVRLREILVLRELEGLSYKEIAAVVGVPIGTVMSSLFRAREHVRRQAGDLVGRHARPQRFPSVCGAADLELQDDAVPV